MTEDFDIGPLSWVKDEIDQALKSVLENLAAVAANPEDVAVMRFSKTHLYQVSGALDMVGLEGCKRFCAEIEKLAGKLEKKTVPASPEILEILNRAVNALSSYLQDLLNGSPDMPIRLFPMLQTMVLVQGESVEESELFFPDTSLRAPKDIPSIQLDEAALPAYIAEQRSHYQKSLLSWLKDASQDGLGNMRTAIENVQQIQQQPAQKTLWWAASAFTDALSQDAISGNMGVKRLCRRLDQQLRSLNEGVARASGNLLRDILYYVALSAPDTERITKVKNVFELHHLLPDEVGQGLTSVEITEAEMEALARLKYALEVLKDIWAAVSDGKVDALGDFLYQLSNIIEPSQSLTDNAVAHLFSCVHELATALDLDAGKVTETALIEVAAGLNLLEDALQNYGCRDAEATQRLATQAQRLQDVMGGGPIADFSGTPISDHLGTDVLLAVAQQIKDSLKIAEQALDTYFRHPADRQVLQGTEKPVQQVIAAFDMLDLPVPTAITKACSKFIDYFRDEAHEPNPALFELVAESLSMLGFYVEELPRTRPESFIALEAALARLGSQLHELGLATEEVEQKTAAQSADDNDTAFNEAKPLTSDTVTAPVSESKVIDRAFDAELLDIYLTEVEEVLAHIAQNIQALRINATEHEALVEVRRGYHTLKGSGRTVGLVVLGEVAWAVERMLNLVMERKLVPSPLQLTFIEQTSAAFAGWAATLREAGAVELDPQIWQQQAAALESESAAQKPIAVAEEVVIGGTRKMSRALFDIFMNEAEQHMQTLKQGLAALSVDSLSKPTAASHRAAHTLASNAGTAGFNSIEDLAKALENWFDSHRGYWTSQELTLLGNVTTALADMLRKAGQLRQPKAASWLLTALKEAVSQTDLIYAGADDSIIDIASDAMPEEWYSEGLAAIAVKTEALKEGIPETAVEIDVPMPLAAQEPAASAFVAPVPVIETTAQVAAVDQELLTMFVEEARELVPQVGNELRAWRADPQNSEHPDALQRALHTLKGSGRMAGQALLGDTVHGMEDRIMRALKSKVSAVDFDDMFVDLDHIGGLLEAAIDSIGEAGRTTVIAGATGIVQAGRSTERRTQYLRLRADVLDRLINEAGEISITRSRMEREIQSFKQFSLDLTESVFRLRNHLRELEIEAESQLQSRMMYLQEANETFDPLEFDRFTRLQELTRMLAESVNDVSTIQHGLLMNLDETESALQQQSRMNHELQHGLMNVRMVPFSLISERLQRIVRQTARELEKHVEMTIDGEAVEIDRSVLDKIGAPLEHLLRNAVAHGMETPAQRKRMGKPELGSITLKVRQENDEIVITVADDGGGINLERVREKAIQNGLLAADHKISEQALLSVIFEPGFSTADAISQIAGRGVGLDAVRSDITTLGGRIDVSNALGLGAVFSTYLPVTLSVAQVVLVRVGVRVFALPAVMVEQVQKLKSAELAEAYEAHNIRWSDRQYPLYLLGKLINEADHLPEVQRYTPLLLLRSGTYRIALHVDEIIGNQEVVMKAIGPQLARVPGMIGATVMGDGKIVLIINPVQLANREVLAVGAVKVSTVAPVKLNTAPVVLVVDDSLTMRKVLGRTLEREGYQVITAKDGMDALQILQETQPDIILSDIEMPRMDGFELTRNVRGDSRTANTPLIIISSRTAEKHRNLAQELGVNAFLGKPVQDDELMAQISMLLGNAMPLATA